jgi:hypothetical protein
MAKLPSWSILKKENIVLALLSENYELGRSPPVIPMHSAGTNIHESEVQTISYERNIVIINGNLKSYKSENKADNHPL